MTVVRTLHIYLLPVLAAVALGGCNKTAIDCASEDATNVISDLVRTTLEDATYAKLRESELGGGISRSKIRAAIAQMNVAILDVRTSKVDPNSTKRFCEGSLKLRFPVEVLNQADSARTEAQLSSVNELADSSDIERQANSFLADMEYDVQPTDEGDKVYGETQTDTTLLQFASEVLSSSLLNSAIHQQAVETRQVEEAAAAAQNAAFQEQKAANLNSARTDNQIATQSILAVWRAVAKDTRDQLLPSQRAWSRKKDADCRVEAASASTDPTEVEVARLNCDTRMTQERMNWLQQYREVANSSNLSTPADPEISESDL